MSCLCEVMGKPLSKPKRLKRFITILSYIYIFRLCRDFRVSDNRAWLLGNDKPFNHYTGRNKIIG